VKTDLCERCSTPLPNNEKLVTVHRQREGKHFIFERVPARVCQRCGERYYASQTVREMDDLMKKPVEPANMVEVPIIALKPVR
jgi:YgiT-type zinc finger domain-containing protein